MKLSALMSVRDGERFLAEALDSIFADDLQPDEVVVVDDGSTDASATILDSYGDRLRRDRIEPSGISVGLNRAVAVSTGDVITFLDSDDLWVPGRTRALLSPLADAEIDASFGLVEQFGDDELTPDEHDRLTIDTTPQFSYLHTTMAVRRSVATSIGPFDPTLRTAPNLDWMSRARAAGMRAALVHEVVLRRRIHTTNVGRRQWAQKHADLLEVVRRHRARSAQEDAP